jgi:hypothetical protein
MKRNRSTKAILAAYDSQNGYTVVSFDSNDVRVLTYSHLDPLKAIEYVQQQNLCGHSCLVFHDGDLEVMEGCNNDKDFFVNKLYQLRHKDDQFEENPKGDICKRCAKFEWSCKCYPIKCAKTNCNCEYSHN